MKNHVCPYCGTSYRHASMAARCLKTQSCRMFNAPGSTRRFEWEIQAGTVTMCLFLARPLEEHETGRMQELAVEIIHASGLICDHLRHTLPVGEVIAQIQGKKILDACEHSWRWNQAAMIVHLLEVISNLVGDVLSYLRPRWEAGQDDEGRRLWSLLDDKLTALYDECNPEGDECEESWKTPEVYERLRLAIWGPEKQARTPSLYLANEKIWLVAHGRPEARRCLLRELGLSRPTLQGIAPGEVMEDGSTAADMIALAGKNVPAIVGTVPA